MNFADSPFDRATRAHAHPPDWRNPVAQSKYHLVVIGAGTAGLVSAAGAALLGARVALIEKHLMGGDCLNTGCVPSKALIASAQAVADLRRAPELGLKVAQAEVDFPAIMERMRRLRAEIALNDGAERFRKLGIDIFFGEGRFAGPDAITVAGQTLRFARAVIATGGRAAIPDVPGLADSGYLTNETIFDLKELPPRLAVIGGGPIGCELAQTFARFGSQVTILQRNPQLLPREDEDVSALLRVTFEREGLTVELQAGLERVEKLAGARRLTYSQGAKTKTLEVDAILVAVGRQPNVEGLDLEPAGIETGRQGIVVDDFLRTSNRRVSAAGDVASPWQFTHAADAQARVVLQNALFSLRRKASVLRIPWSTYTDPEVAGVGLSKRTASERGLSYETVEVPFAELDRAILEGETEGFLRILVDRRGRILGASVFARNAGDLIAEISVAMAAGLPLGKLSQVIHPYPTRAEAVRKAADIFNRGRFGPRLKQILGTYFSWRFG